MYSTERNSISVISYVRDTYYFGITNYCFLFNVLTKP